MGNNFHLYSNQSKMCMHIRDNRSFFSPFFMFRLHSNLFLWTKEKKRTRKKEKKERNGGRERESGKELGECILTAVQNKSHRNRSQKAFRFYAYHLYLASTSFSPIQSIQLWNAPQCRMQKKESLERTIWIDASFDFLFLIYIFFLPRQGKKWFFSSFSIDIINSDFQNCAWYLFDKSAIELLFLLLVRRSLVHVFSSYS